MSAALWPQEPLECRLPSNVRDEAPQDGRRGRGFELHVIVDINDFNVPVRHYPLSASHLSEMVEVAFDGTNE